MKSFADLTEREVLAVAISGEEEDSRIYMSAVPRTTSRPLTLALPVRNSRPSVTSARSLIRTGVAARVATTISPTGNFPLHHAAELDDPILIDILVENGAPLAQKWQN